MTKRKQKSIQCKKCGDLFMAVRSDACYCANCHKQRRTKWQKSSIGRESRAKSHRRIREESFAGYGGKCQCCGEERFEFLALDHVNGGGRKEREKLSTRQISQKVIANNFPPEYRVLCHNCNSAIGWYGYCPHNK
jgi:hypothetical protein